jgi:hypothetical protein
VYACILCCLVLRFHRFLDTSIEAPPSVLPHRHLCDITGLEVLTGKMFLTRLFYLTIKKAPYTDPTTGIRYHDKSVYEIVKGLVSLFIPLCIATDFVTSEYEYGEGFSIW